MGGSYEAGRANSVARATMDGLANALLTYHGKRYVLADAVAFTDPVQ